MGKGSSFGGIGSIARSDRYSGLSGEGAQPSQPSQPTDPSITTQANPYATPVNRVDAAPYQMPAVNLLQSSGNLGVHPVFGNYGGFNPYSAPYMGGKGGGQSRFNSPYPPPATPQAPNNVNPELPAIPSPVPTPTSQLDSFRQSAAYAGLGPDVTPEAEQAAYRDYMRATGLGDLYYRKGGYVK